MSGLHAWSSRATERRRFSFFVGTLALAVLPGCQLAVLDPAGPVGRDERTILLGSLVIMLVIVIPTIVATLVVAGWYRASNTRARYLPQWSESGQIEMVVWAIPVMVILLLGGVAWIGARALDPAKRLEPQAEAIDIDVVSLDWKWLFIYRKEQVASVNQLVVPAGVPLHFTLTSASVMNTFFIPRLGTMIYTMNGMATELNLLADEPGVLRGLSGHYSGAGFSDMHFDVRAVTPVQFAAWVETVRKAGGPALDDARYAALAVQGVQAAPSTFPALTPDLFNKIVMQHLAPGPGPTQVGPATK